MKSMKLAATTLVLFSQANSNSLLAGNVTVGAYAVANHSSCGAGNIPGTILEMDKFFDSPNFSSILQKNFYWKDQRVKNSEWIKDGDYRQSTETNTGFDGSDASVLTYIASHGVTSGGIYKALAGSRNNGGCYIPTSNMELGNQISRYTILSTCQGLKIGNGDNPTAAGENPTRTWKNAAKGLNCIFGYSNNMADADQYGEFLLENIKNGETPLAKAFMDASESVSVDNIPAVMCYGATERDAADYIASNKGFDTETRPNTASAWVYRMVNSQAAASAPTAKIPAAIRVVSLKLNIGKLASTFLGASLSKSINGKSQRFTSNSGLVDFDTATGTLTVSNNLVEDAKISDVPSATEAEQIAIHALKVSGISKAAGNLSLAATSEDVLGGESGVVKVIARKFTFRQKLAGGQTLSQQGSIDVTVAAGGAITEIKSALLQVDGRFRATLRPTEISSRIEELESQAMRHVAEKVPGANYKIIKQRIGFDAGNFHKRKSTAAAVVELTVEASQGEFARRYIEKFTL
jgi:hypothetical protein